MSKVFGMLLALTLSLGTLSYVAAGIDDGLISVWTFDDGTAKDLVGPNDGEFKGTGYEIVDGMYGKAVKFDGTDGYITVPHDKSLEAIADGMTMTCWINIERGVNHAAVIFKGEKIGWTNNYAFRLATLGSNTGLTWGVCVPGTEGYFATDNAYNVGEWYFCCLTADGTQAMGRVSKAGSGKLETPASGQGNPRPIAAPYRTCPDFPIEMGVGRAVNGTVGNDAYLVGTIDEIYIYSRPLADDEVLELAKGARPAGTAVHAQGKLATVWARMK